MEVSSSLIAPLIALYDLNRQCVKVSKEKVNFSFEINFARVLILIPLRFEKKKRKKT